MKKIIYSTPSGVTVVHPTGLVPIEHVIANDLPPGADYEIIEAEDLPEDRMFRAAWRKSDKALLIDIDGAKEIAHEMRRKARDAEMAPLDLRSTIPREAAAAEAERDVLRQKYADLQLQIDAAASVEELKTLVAG